MDFIRSNSMSSERTNNTTPPAVIAKLPENLAEKAGEKLQLSFAEGGQKISDEVVKDREKMEKEKERERERGRYREKDRNRDIEGLKALLIGLSEIMERIQLLERNRDWNKERENERERDRGKRENKGGSEDAT